MGDDIFSSGLEPLLIDAQKMGKLEAYNEILGKMEED
jgi:hypothetical protein